MLAFVLALTVVGGAQGTLIYPATAAGQITDQIVEAIGSGAPAHGPPSAWPSSTNGSTADKASGIGE